MDAEKGHAQEKFLPHPIRAYCDRSKGDATTSTKHGMNDNCSSQYALRHSCIPFISVHSPVIRGKRVCALFVLHVGRKQQSG